VQRPRRGAGVSAPRGARCGDAGRTQTSRWGPRAFAPGGSAAAGTRGAGESWRKPPLGRTARTFEAGTCLPKMSPNARLQEKKSTNRSPTRHRSGQEPDTKLFTLGPETPVQDLGTQAGWAGPAESSRQRQRRGEKSVPPLERTDERLQSPRPTVRTDRQHQPRRPSRGKRTGGGERWLGSMSFINKLKLISVFTGPGLQAVARLEAPSLKRVPGLPRRRLHGPIPSGSAGRRAASKRAPGEGPTPPAATEPPPSTALQHRARGRRESAAASSPGCSHAGPRPKAAQDSGCTQQGALLVAGPRSSAPRAAHRVLSSVL